MAGRIPRGGKTRLSPPVADLVERVAERVANAATVQEIRDLADSAAQEARDNALTVAQIRELADVAIERAKRVDVLVNRLAVLMADDG